MSLRCIETYSRIYHKDPEAVVFCPYRVSPLGAHIDHQYGKINGLAIDKGIYIAYSAKTNGVVELQSLNFPKRAQFHVSYPRFFKNDLSVYEKAEEIIGITDYIIHLADIVAGIDYVFANEGELFRVNNLINSNLFAAVRKAGKGKVKGLMYVGTVCSFPLTRQNTVNPEPLREEELFPAYPESAYGWSKLIGQLELGYLEKEIGIPCCTLMFHNVYGTPNDYGVRSQVIPALIRKAVNYPEEEFVVWGSGKQGRAFIHVNDAVNALVLALDKGWGHGWIQIGPSNCTSIKEIAYKVAEISNKGIVPFFDTTKPEGDKARCADYTKAKEILGWEPTVSLDEGLRECYTWIEKQIKAEKEKK